MHTEQTDLNSKLQKFEYRVERLGDLHQLEKILNRLGEEHWEFVTVTIDEGGTQFPVFKRPRPYREGDRETASNETELIPPGQRRG